MVSSKMSTHLLDLPDEVVAKVFTWLSKVNSKSARLTCRRLSNVGAEFLIQRVYFAPRKAVMERFAAIAEHPVFSKYVTEVVYDARLFSQYMQIFLVYAANLAKLNQSSGANLINQDRLIKGTDYKPVEAQKCYNRYKGLYIAQQTVLEESLDLQNLSFNLPRLPKKMQVSVADTFSPSDNASFRSCDDHTWYEEMCVQEIGSTEMPSIHCYRDLEDQGHWRCINNLLAAIITRCPDLKLLRFGSLNTSPMPLQFFRCPMAILTGCDFWDDI